MKIKILSAILWVSFIGTCFTANSYANDVQTLSDGTGLVLYGLGRYEDLGEEIYIGAIYVPLLEFDFDPETAKRMQMRISVDSLSARRFVRFWLDGITLNSSREERNALATQIQQFGDLLTVGLKKGDQVNFDYLPATAKTELLINGIKAGEITGTGFYQLLLNAWVGPTPPSSKFKQGLLREKPEEQLTELETEFLALGFSEDRTRELSMSIGAERERLLEAQRQAEIEQQRLEEEERQRQLEEERRLEEELAEAERLVQQTEEEEAARLEAERLARLEEEAARRAEREAQIEAEQRVIRDEYHSQLVNWIGRYLHYPERALVRNHTGRVDLEITTNRNGVVLEREVSSSSGYSLLDRAALDMVDDAEPLPEFPDDLLGSTFRFAMPINFTIED